MGTQSTWGVSTQRSLKMRLIWTSLALVLASLWHVQGYTCPPGKSKKTITLGVGESVDFSTQDADSYGKNVKCVVKFKKAKNAKCELNFSCSAFTLTAKNSKCNRGSDFLKIGKEKFCEDNSPDVTVAGRTLNVLFRSNKRSKGGEGAECEATCVDPDDETPTTVAPPATTPTPPVTTAAPTTACTGSACTSILNRRSLEEYNNAICNDGSTAVYYVDEEAHRDGQSVMVYLEGGGACYTDQTCSDRCEGAEAEYLCEAQTDPVKDFNDHVWSKDPTTNPGLHDSLKVYVPYCTSDGYSGRRPASSESGGYAFFGKAVVEGLVEDLLEKVIGSNSIRQFTLMGVSAGAFGVAFNCDAVAAKVKAKDPNADVRCIMDSHDFIPTDVSEGCNPLEWGSLAKTYWQGEFDQSCEQASGADSTQCNVFTTYYQQITTPFMVIVPLEEVDPGVHPCTPEWPEDSNFWSRWREALYTAAQQLAQDMPNSGMFMSNCAHHVTLANPTTWSAMPVPPLDSNDQASVTLNQVLSNWLKDTRPFQALDGPTTRNPSCPYND